MTYYSRRHYERVCPPPDTVPQIAERIREREISEQANREMMERFAPLTLANAQAAVDWQEARIRELRKGSET